MDFSFALFLATFEPLEIYQSYVPFGKPRSVVIMPEKLKGRVACLYCARPVKMAVLLHKQAKLPYSFFVTV